MEVTKSTSKDKELWLTLKGKNGDWMVVHVLDKENGSIKWEKAGSTLNITIE